MIRAVIAALALACIAAATGCGQKGPLKLPEPAPEKQAPKT